MSLPSQSSPFAAILGAVVARLVSSVGINSAWVTVVANDRYVLTELEPLSIRVQVFPPRPLNSTDGGILVDQGAGRLAVNLSRFLRVYMYSRSGLDVSESDNTGLMGSDPDATVSEAPTVPGHFLYEERVLAALHHFAPVVDGQCLSLGPIRFSIDNEAPERKAEDSEGVIRSCIDFEVDYIASIDTADPAS